MAEPHNYSANGLEINFLGLPMVCNDGTTKNTLRLGLTNNNFFGALEPDTTTIVFTPHTPIYIWFIVDLKQASETATRSWALTSNDALHDENVTLAIMPDPDNWDIERADDLMGNPLNDSLKGWKLTPKLDVRLLPAQSLVVTLSGLTTDLPDGPTSGYCQVDLPSLDVYGKEAKRVLKVLGPILKSRVTISDAQNGVTRQRVTVGADVDVQGTFKSSGGDVSVESSHSGGLGPRLRIINTAGGKGSAGAIEFSGFDTRTVENGDIPVHRISCEDDGNGSGDLIFFQKPPGQQDPLTERLRLRSDGQVLAGAITTKRSLTTEGTLTTHGDASVGGDLTAQGRIQDKTGAVMPVGAIVAYGGNQPPAGWLLCDGNTIPVEDRYSELRSIVGATTPDLRGRFVVGAGQGADLSNYDVRATGGKERHTLTIGEMPRHRHTINNGDFGLHNRSFQGSDDRDRPFETGTKENNLLGGTDNEGGSEAHNNLPPYYALTYIIKC